MQVSTLGIDHLGLTVNDLDASAHFFVDVLGWEESGRDNSYPRCSVTDGYSRLTLWQVDKSQEIVGFNRKVNIGLHHLALKVESEQILFEVYEKVKSYGCELEFSPEFMGKGPRKHFICTEPGGNRLEFTWNGN